ncbi:MAG: lamin tail domain-containing protein [Chitinophagaceae bacterium]|nr:lamin tail domain-containing protein [Chitinophagaceae bacterium]
MKTLIKLMLVFICTTRFCGSLYAQVAGRNDIVIGELMADPSPPVSLPNNEWIELCNISATAFNLLGWRIGDASGQSGPMPSYILLPDSFVIVCTGSAVATMSAFGPAISVTGFPSLDNTGDQIYLRSPQNRIIHAVNYSDSWYGNALKRRRLVT